MRKAKGTSNRKRSRRSPEQLVAAVNNLMRHGLVLAHDGLWVRAGHDAISLHVPDDLRQDIWSALAGRGPTPVALAKRLSRYGLSEWERRFMNVFPADEPDAVRLQERTDHTWVVIPRRPA